MLLQVAIVYAGGVARRVGMTQDARSESAALSPQA